MPIYKAPVRDMRFVYDELLQGGQLQLLPGFEDIDANTVEAILEEAGKFCENELLPINRNGDEEGCHFDNGKVTTPQGFKSAYKAFTEAGWGSIAMDANYGGQGLPKTLHMMIDEMVCATNLSFSLYPGLTNGAYSAMDAYADDRLKAIYFPKMAEGTWSGSMCLTEPHCGTDLGLLRTKAEPQADGSYLITGTKIFITAGEHDLTDNILHLVLARTPDAPPGIKGISLFLVPKIVVENDGSLGERNGVSCGAIEHKMGIKASATCVMNFDNARGFLIGALNKGMRAMFKMMNTERVAVGVQGLGVADAAYQNAVEYAAERLQGRAPTGTRQPQKSADPLTVHPDVRRMLLTMRANVEGCRAFSIWLGMLLDVSARAVDAEQRQEAEDLVALLTPVAKAFMTDIGFEAANLGMQVFGGHGYIREHGMEQLVRDVRIAQLYEGTNGIQAMDLVGRKLTAEGGRYLQRYAAVIEGFIGTNNERFPEYTGPLASAFEGLKDVTGWLTNAAGKDANEIGAAACDYLRLMGLVTLGYLWARMAVVATDNIGSDSEAFYQAKLKTARFFLNRLLPQTKSLVAAVRSGAGDIMAFTGGEF